MSSPLVNPWTNVARTEDEAIVHIPLGPSTAPGSGGWSSTFGQAKSDSGDFDGVEEVAGNPANEDAEVVVGEVLSVSRWPLFLLIGLAGVAGLAVASLASGSSDQQGHVAEEVSYPQPSEGQVPPDPVVVDRTEAAILQSPAVTSDWLRSAEAWLGEWLGGETGADPVVAAWRYEVGSVSCQVDPAAPRALVCNAHEVSDGLTRAIADVWTYEASARLELNRDGAPIPRATEYRVEDRHAGVLDGYLQWLRENRSREWAVERCEVAYRDTLPCVSLMVDVSNVAGWLKNSPDLGYYEPWAREAAELVPTEMAVNLVHSRLATEPPLGLESLRDLLEADYVDVGCQLVSGDEASGRFECRSVGHTDELRTTINPAWTYDMLYDVGVIEGGSEHTISGGRVADPDQGLLDAYMVWLFLKSGRVALELDCLARMHENLECARALVAPTNVEAWKATQPEGLAF